MGKPTVQVETASYQSRVTVKQMKFQKWGSLANFIACIVFFILTITSICFYAGGNRKEKFTLGFNFLYTALSDLGRGYAINLEPNTIAQAIFIPGFVILGLSIIVFYIVIDTFYKDTKKIKWLSLTGAILGVVSGVLYLYIAMTPVDIDVKLHNKFIYSAAPFKFGALICFTIVTFIDKKLPRKFSYLFLIILIDYLLLGVGVTVGSLIGGDVNKIVRIFGHTLAIFIEVILSAILSLLLFFHISKTSNNHLN